MIAQKATPLEIFQLNHASLLLVMGGIRLLTDPWFEGTAFDHGWTLRWDNPEAYRFASTATHMWISHPHSDHLHYPTLKRLHALNPNMTMLANHSYNYNLEKQVRSLGFHSILTLRENQIVTLDEHCTMQRMGSGIIDSLLVIRWKNITLLNLNDCVLQERALRHIARKIGKIDLLLCNFNHAGKLLHYPEKSSAQVRSALKQHYRMQASALRPRCILPFASHHQYLSLLSIDQNASLLEPSDLKTATNDAQTIVLYPGQHANLDFSVSDVRAYITGGMPMTNIANKYSAQENSAKEGKFSEAIAVFEQRIAKSFGPLRVFLPNVTFRILETQKIYRIRHGRIKEEAEGIFPDIEAHYAKILHWFSHPFGTDAFVVGAHFRILRPCIGRLKFLIALLLLTEAKIMPRVFLDLALWAFLFRRRHEALAALLSWRVSSSYQ